jgi:pimeloyl-ACP methyl ester carboxylesterase
VHAAFLALALLTVAAPATRASDLAREGRIASEIAGAVREGTIRRIEAGDSDFLAIDTPSKTGETRGGVILLHGRGAHPDWPDVIRPLRVGLPAAGWRTLAIQLPVAAADAPDAAWDVLVAEAGPRIAAAVAALRQEQPRQPVALVGHGLGARMAVEYLASAPAGAVQAFVAVGLPAGIRNAPATVDALAKAPLPILDLYGSRDLEPVRGGAADRLQAARRAGNAAYRQAEVAGADHQFSGMGNALLARVRAWLHGKTAKDLGSAR